MSEQAALRKPNPETSAPPNKRTFQNKDDWLKARKQSIGGSDAAVILGIDPFKSPFALYSEKAGLVKPDDLTDNEVVEWGQRLEGPVVEAYQDKTGRKINRHGIHLFCDKTHPLSVSLDGELLPIDDRGPGVLEIKTTGRYSEKELREEIPLHWAVQIQHELGVMGWSWASLAVLLLPARRLRHIDVERNDEFIDLLFQREIEFFDRIKSLNPPPVDGSDSSTEVLNKLFPKDTGSEITLPPEAIKWDATLIEAKSQLKHWESVRKEQEAKFKAAIGDATFGSVPSGIKYSWRLQERAGYEVKPTSFRVLRRHE